MASAKAIISAVNSKHPDLTVTDIFNYSDGWIVIAKKDPNSKDEADPFYKVTKNGEVVDISSADDPTGFRRALSAGAVWSNKGSKGVKHEGMKGKSLSHHGVKGQKWGVRRWQNSDGSWTPEGNARRRKSGISNKEFSSFAKASSKAKKEYDKLYEKFDNLKRNNDSNLYYKKISQEEHKKIDGTIEKMFYNGMDRISNKYNTENRYAKFMQKVDDELGSFYEGSFKNKNFEKAANDYDKSKSAATADKLAKVALKEMGLEITPENIYAMKTIIFID